MKTGVLLVNLGTPDKPETADVKTYLSEFLNDGRVIDLSPIKRKLLVNMVIVPFRSRNSAKLYKRIWTDRGSPLMYHSLDAKSKLQELLGSDFSVELGMRYRSPGIESGLNQLKKNGVKKIIVFPLFPQYASATVGSVNQKVMEIIQEWEVIPEIKFINNFFEEPTFIKAWGDRAKESMEKQYDHYLFSFHGLPERQIKKADRTGYCLNHEGCCSIFSEKNYFCYRAQCFKTASDIAHHLQITNYTVSFQSRLGKSPWIKPYTDNTLKLLAEKGVKRILVFAPAFVSDCLETIYEIGIEYEENFRKYGGEELRLVESLNSHDSWIESMRSIIYNNL